MWKAKKWRSGKHARGKPVLKEWQRLDELMEIVMTKFNFDPKGKNYKIVRANANTARRMATSDK
jgi:hypothetical protein